MGLFDKLRSLREETLTNLWADWMNHAYTLYIGIIGKLDNKLSR